MQNPAPQGAHYVWQFGNDITKGAAWRDDAVAFLVEPPDVFVIITFNRAARELVWAKHSRETAVNRVRTTSIIGVHRKPQIFAIGPVLLTTRIDDIRLGLKPADFGQRKFRGPFAISKFHGHIAPSRFHLHFRLADFGNDFATQLCRSTNVCSKKNLAVSGGSSQGKAKPISNIPHQLISCRWLHLQLVHAPRFNPNWRPAKSPGC